MPRTPRDCLSELRSLSPNTPSIVLDVIFFSSVSGNTARFVERLGGEVPDLRRQRLPLRRSDAVVRAERPFLLITPTYGGGTHHGAVPKQVIRFLNDAENRALMRGVVSMGNTNFGPAYGLAGDVIASKCGVPHLARVELFGLPEDVSRVAALLAHAGEEGA